jgi:hypothetical protein
MKEYQMILLKAGKQRSFVLLTKIRGCIAIKTMERN